MSLGLALINNVSGLRINQEALSQVSNNITNANTENYTRREITQSANIVDGEVAGVRLDEVRRVVDNYLTQNARRQIAPSEQSAIKDTYYKRIELFFGQPGEDNGLNAVTDNFFGALGDFANAPELSYNRSNAVEAAINLENSISGLAQQMEQMRLDIDGEISSTVSEINSKIERLQSINLDIVEARRNNANTTASLDERDSTLMELSGLIDVSVVYASDGTVDLFLPRADLLNGSQRYELTYAPISTFSALISGSTISQISAVPVNDDGTIDENGFRATLYPASNDTTSQPLFTSGKLMGLLEMRDDELPQLIAQLDRFAGGLRDAYNAIHNDGVGYPPANSLTGTRLVSSTDTHSFSGSFQLAVLNEDGTPALGSYGDGAPINPLTLNLSEMYSGSSGAGNVTLGTIIDAINEYYGPPGAKATLGPLDDIKLNLVSSNVDTVAASSFLTFGPGLPTAGQQLDVDGVVYTFVDAPTATSGTNIQIKSTINNTLQGVANHLNGIATGATTQATYSVDNNTLTATLVTAGSTANDTFDFSTTASIVAASRPFITFGPGLPTAGQQLTVDGVTFDFVNAPAPTAGTDIQIQGTLNDTVLEIANHLGTFVAGDVAQATSYSANGATLTAYIASPSDITDGAFALSTTAATVTTGTDAAIGGVDTRGIVEFDLSAFNLSDVNADISLAPAPAFSITPALAGVTLSGPSTNFTSKTISAGEMTRTAGGPADNVIALDFSASTLQEGDTITINVPVRVTTTDNSTVPATVVNYDDVISYNFTIPDPNEDVTNLALSPVSTSDLNNYTAVSSNQRYLTAEIVDADGNVVGEGEEGYLRIRANGNLGIGIDQLDSRELGVVGNATATQTNFGLSHFFGLNDFFAANTDADGNDALNFSIREAYKTNTSLLAAGSLTRSLQPADESEDPIYTYEVGIGNNVNVQRLADLAITSQNFAAAGFIPNSTQTFSGYAAEIVSFTSIRANQIELTAEQTERTYTLYRERMESISGVNIDEELANTVLFQNNYNATARMLTVISELFETLLDTF